MCNLSSFFYFTLILPIDFMSYTRIFLWLIISLSCNQLCFERRRWKNIATACRYGYESIFRFIKSVSKWISWASGTMSSPRKIFFNLFFCGSHPEEIGLAASSARFRWIERFPSSRRADRLWKYFDVGEDHRVIDARSPEITSWIAFSPYGRSPHRLQL